MKQKVDNKGVVDMVINFNLDWGEKLLKENYTDSNNENVLQNLFNEGMDNLSYNKQEKL